MVLPIRACAPLAREQVYTPNFTACLALCVHGYSGSVRPLYMCIPMRTHMFNCQCSSVVPHARGLLASALGFRPVAEDTHSMAHCKRFKKNKAKFFLGLALKTCIEGNCIEKARFIAIKPVKSRVYGGCKNFHQFNQDKCLVRGMTLISRGHQFFK